MLALREAIMFALLVETQRRGGMQQVLTPATIILVGILLFLAGFPGIPASEIQIYRGDPTSDLPPDMYSQLKEQRDYCHDVTRKVISGEYKVSADAAALISGMNMAINTFWVVIEEMKQKGYFDK